MPATSPWIIEGTTERFETDVIRASAERPVVVDFWATWCQPCRQLGPLLEKLAAEFNGRFQLVKVDVDANQELAAAFGVQSIPYVVALRDGRPVSEFVGVHPEDKLREWLSALLPSKAEELLNKGAAWNRPIRKGPWPRTARRRCSNRTSTWLRVALARVLLALNQDDECKKIIADLESRGYLEPEAEKIKSQLELRAAAAEAGPVDEARKAAASAPNDLSLKLKLADALAVANKHEEALQICLELVQNDKGPLGAEAKSTMLRIFDAMGTGSDLVQRVPPQTGDGPVLARRGDAGRNSQPRGRRSLFPHLNLEANPVLRERDRAKRSLGDERFEFRLGIGPLQQNVAEGPFGDEAVHEAQPHSIDGLIDRVRRGVPPQVDEEGRSAGLKDAVHFAKSGLRLGKVLNAARHTRKSNVSLGKGMAEAFPSRKSTATPAWTAFVRAISTNVRLMSSPATR